MLKRGTIRLHIPRFDLESLSCLVYETEGVEKVYYSGKMQASAHWTAADGRE